MCASSLLPLQKEAVMTTIHSDYTAHSFRCTNPHLNGNTAQLTWYFRSHLVLFGHIAFAVKDHTGQFHKFLRLLNIDWGCWCISASFQESLDNSENREKLGCLLLTEGWVIHKENRCAKMINTKQIRKYSNEEKYLYCTNSAALLLYDSPGPKVAGGTGKACLRLCRARSPLIQIFSQSNLNFNSRGVYVMNQL